MVECNSRLAEWSSEVLEHRWCGVEVHQCGGRIRTRKWRLAHSPGLPPPPPHQTPQSKRSWRATRCACTAASRSHPAVQPEGGWIRAHGGSAKREHLDAKREHFLLCTPCPHNKNGTGGLVQGEHLLTATAPRGEHMIEMFLLHLQHLCLHHLAQLCFDTAHPTTMEMRTAHRMWCSGADQACTRMCSKVCGPVCHGAPHVPHKRCPAHLGQVWEVRLDPCGRADVDALRYGAVQGTHGVPGVVAWGGGGGEGTGGLLRCVFSCQLSAPPRNPFSFGAGVG